MITLKPAGNQQGEQLRPVVQTGKIRRSWIPISLICWLALQAFEVPKAEAGSLIAETKRVVSGPTENPSYITGGQCDLLLMQGYYHSSFLPSPRRPIFAFAETYVQLR